MKKTLIVAGIAAAALIGIAVVSYVSYFNYGVSQETAIKNRYENAKNVMSRVSNSIMEAVQIPEIAKNDLVEVINAATTGRYGADGANNILLSIQEANPGQIDPSLYTRIQDLIKEGRIDFANEQKFLIDNKGAYGIALGSFWSGFWLRTAGYPKLDLDQFQIVINEQTEQIFSTGRDEPMKLGG